MKWISFLYGALYLYFCTDFIKILYAYNNSEGSHLSKLFESALITGAVSVTVYIFDSLIPSKCKNWLLGPKNLSASGYTVFSRIKTGRFKDERVSCNTAQAAYNNVTSNLPTSKRERMMYENEQWSKLYVTLENNGSVKQSQRDWLLCRDMYVETILFFIFYLISTFLFSNVSFSFELLLILLSMTIILNLAAHNKMKRFVYTVIAKDIFTKMNKNESEETEC